MIRQYVITENQLINFLTAEMYSEMLERDGVEDWPMYQNSYNEVVRDYYPGDLLPEDEVSMYDCARARIEAGEFQEELNLDEFVLAYDLASGEDMTGNYDNY